MMKKFLTAAASVFLFLALLVHTGSTANTAFLSADSEEKTELSGFNKIVFLLESEVATKDSTVCRPACLLFGHQLTEGVACLTSYGEYAVYPDSESSYYVVAYCERCGYFSILFTVSNRIGTFSS